MPRNSLISPAELGRGTAGNGTQAHLPVSGVTSRHRRSVCWGAGANLIRILYVSRRCESPTGKYSTLQESKATGYANDLPVKSYDFQTCLRENGLPSESYETAETPCFYQKYRRTAGTGKSISAGKYTGACGCRGYGDTAGGLPL